MKERGNCKICKEPIAIGKMTKWEDGNYYCANCQIDLNNQLDMKTLLENRQKEIMEQFCEVTTALIMIRIQIKQEC